MLFPRISFHTEGTGLALLNITKGPVFVREWSAVATEFSHDKECRDYTADDLKREPYLCGSLRSGAVEF